MIGTQHSAIVMNQLKGSDKQKIEELLSNG